MSLYVRRYGEIDFNIDLKYCKILLHRLGELISDVKLVVYKEYPNVSQGKIIAEVNNPLERDVRVNDLVRDPSIIFNCIYEFKFKLKVNDIIFDGYLRRNNLRLAKIYGQFEFDIFGNKEISNLGDLIITVSNKIKEIIQDWIINDALNLKIPIREAYISSSVGDADIDLSKRVWIYYANPADFLKDVIKFIKYFEEIEAPKYLKEEYEQVIDRLDPYDETFIASQLYSSNKFKSRFEEYVKENNIAVGTGSLIISSNDLDSNFVFAREVSEKIVFPIMKSVPGRKDFIDIINQKLT